MTELERTLFNMVLARLAKPMPLRLRRLKQRADAAMAQARAAEWKQQTPKT